VNAIEIYRTDVLRPRSLSIGLLAILGAAVAREARGRWTPAGVSPTHRSTTTAAVKKSMRRRAGFIEAAELVFQPTDTAARQALLAIRLEGAGPIATSIGGEPVFVDDLCRYFKGKDRTAVLDWLRKNVTIGTPVHGGLNINGATVGHCSNLANFYGQVASCGPGVGASNVTLSGLHVVSLVRDPGAQGHSLVDSMASFAVDGIGDVQALSRARLNEVMGPSLTKDGFQVPSGISESYFLMGLRRFRETRDAYDRGELLADHSRALFDQRLGWVRSHRIASSPLSVPPAPSAIELRNGQSLVIAARPVRHSGLSALQRTTFHLFRAPGAEAVRERFRVMPPAFSNGWLESRPGLIRISIPSDFYAVETEGGCPDGVIAADGKVLPSRLEAGNRIAEISPPRTLRAIRVTGCDRRAARVRAYFLVPDRLVAAMRQSAPRDIVSGRGSVQAEVVPDRDTRRALPKDVAPAPAQPISQAALDALDTATTVQPDGWARYHTAITELWPFAPDFIDHPHPRYVVNRNHGPATLDLHVRVPEGTRVARIGTLGVVSSMENDLTVSASSDGQVFARLYALKPALVSSYAESDFAVSGDTLIVRLVGTRRERLLLHERNFVSVSHVLVWTR
jgi:hypothetical protein